MPKRNKQTGMNATGVTAANANAQNQTTATEFASETNVAEARRQNQKSGANAAQNNPNNPNA